MSIILGFPSCLKQGRNKTAQSLNNLDIIKQAKNDSNVTGTSTGFDKILLKKRAKYRILFHCLVLVLILVPPFSFAHNINVGFDYTIRIFFTTFSIIPSYILNVVFLVPRFLKRRKYWQYIVSMIFLLALFSFVFVFTNPFERQVILAISGSDEYVMEMPIARLPPFAPFFILILTMGTTFEMLLDWEQRGKVIEKAEKEKLSAELSFLKSQINPHFFFNTLNSIYALAATDSYNTQRAILLLSNMMRYVLYESNVERVGLSKEVQFIHDFIDLQKLRYSEINGKKIEFDYQGSITEFEIEPLLLVPFVENAFKHSHSYSKKSEIKVLVAAEGNKDLVFKVSNSIGEFQEKMEHDSGIGLENVKRRLDLLYPDQHELLLERCNGTFNVTLTLTK